MRLSVFSKIFLVFLAAVSSLYLLSLYMHTKSYSMLTREIYASALSNINMYIANVESGLRGIIYSSVQLINSEDITDIALLNEIPADIAVFQKITRLQRQLAILIESFDYIEETYVLFPSSGIKVTYRSRQQMGEADYAKVNDSSFYTGFPFISYAADSGTYVNYSSEYHIASPQPENVRWLIVTKINTAKIMKEADEFFTGDYDEFAFIGEANGLTITSHLNQETFNGILEHQASFNDEMGFNAITTSLDDILAAHRRSDVLRSRFILFTKQRTFLSELSAYRNWIWIVTATMAVLLVVFTVITRRIVSVPINRVIAAIRRGITGELENDIKYRVNEEFEYIYKQFNEMLAVHRKNINRLYEQEIKVLQYQINPHFLYNTFFTMYQLSQAEEYTGLQEMLLRMGNYFKFITKGREFITLAEEVDFCLNYTAIQTIRFSNRINALIENYPEEHAGIVIPRITLQPLLENCYKHGLSNKEKDGLLRMSFDDDGHALTVIIEDNGDRLTEDTLQSIRRGLDEEDDSTTIGLRNVHKRLRSYYGDAYGISVSRSTLGGLRVEAKLPLRRA
jgi:two-component system sensor histidine kinase YesM